MIFVIAMPRPKPRPKTSRAPFLTEDKLFVNVNPRKPVPHEFVLDALASLAPRTNPMFGCLAIYVGEKIVLILREKPKYPDDNGVWLATTVEHHQSLKQEFPNMRSVGIFGKAVTDWQVLPSTAHDFEEAALRACELVLAGDYRIGKIPNAGRTAKRKTAANKPGEINAQKKKARKSDR
ncbi:MAG TPA: hypothetical protein VKR59_04010 [Terriglobales bacterium]|nr:hypothetical protein [Terriglobales bacterium]